MENRPIELGQLRRVFCCNNFPGNIIYQYMKKFLYKLYILKQILPTVPISELLIVVPFLEKCCMDLRIRMYKSQCNIKVFFRLKIYSVIGLN